tara:strand:- start:1361 stop:1816 length:456 start_codon:yes stop_codon:yes gene_type:complete
VSIEVVAGLDEQQILAVWDLHLEWAREEGHDLQQDIWADYMKGLVAGGRYNVWVAWDGQKPVGCAECHIFFDARNGEMCAQGERTYILPAYRSHKVFAAIYQSGLDALQWLGVRRQRAVVAHDETGRFLQKWHESHGLRPIETVMERVLEN